MMRALVTGSGGFTGNFVAKKLMAAGYEVHGLNSMTINFISSSFSVSHVCNLLDIKNVKSIISAVRPDCVIHLAGISNVSHANVEDLYSVNLVGTRNLLEAIASNNQAVPNAIILASSAYVYGNRNQGVLSETSILDPVNDYAVSKLAMEYVAKLYASRLPINIVRPFNYTGVGQSTNFLIPKIVEHIKRKAHFIELGNLEIARDFSDVRMVADYYLKLLLNPQPSGSIFNVCSGRAYTLSNIIDMAMKISGHYLDVKVNQAFVRTNEVNFLVGNKNKLDSAIGPVPVIALEDTLRWMLEAP